MKTTPDNTKLLREFRSIAARGRELWQSSGLSFYRDIAERAEQHIRELATQDRPDCRDKAKPAGGGGSIGVRRGRRFNETY